jgi:hypothetical protein
MHNLILQRITWHRRMGGLNSKKSETYNQTVAKTKEKSYEEILPTKSLFP